MKKLISLIFIAFLFCGDIHATVPVDPGTGLQDNVDYIYLSGVTGLHARFSPLYSVLNGGLDSTNMNLSANFNWTGNHLFDGTLSLGTGGVVFSDDGDGALTITGAGNGSDENLTLNLDDSSNAGVFTSSTGLNALVFDDINLLVKGSSAEKFSVSSTTGNTGVVSGAKICPDSADCSGDSYIKESAANTISHYAGGSELLVVNGPSAAVDAKGNLRVYNGSTFQAAINIDGSINGAPIRAGTYGINLVRATTSATGDSIKIQCSGSACSASNPGHVFMPSTTAGGLTLFRITSDVTINLTGAHWGADTTGDLTGRILRALFVNDNGTLRTCVALLGARDTLLTTDTNATASNIDLPEEVLCNTAVGSSTNTVLEFGYFRVDFDDTGGSSENLNIVQSGVNDVVTGNVPVGLTQPGNSTLSGVSSTSDKSLLWSQSGRWITVTGYLGGTSNSTSFSATLPSSSLGGDYCFGQTTDSGAVQTTPGLVYFNIGISTVSLYKNASSTSTWTNSGAKNASFTCRYQVGPSASFSN